MTLGGLLAFVALVAALVAATLRHPKAGWTYLLVPVVVMAVGGTAGRGIDLASFSVTPDDAFMIVGAAAAAAALLLRFGLPPAIEARLALGRDYPAWAFDRQLTAVRAPFANVVAAGADLDDDDLVDVASSRAGRPPAGAGAPTGEDVRAPADAAGQGPQTSSKHGLIAMLASWRHWLRLAPPDPAWSSFVDRLSSSDGLWAEMRSGRASFDDWQHWTSGDKRLQSEWKRLRAKLHQPYAAGMRKLTLIAVMVAVVSGTCFALALSHVPLALWTTGPPAGRAPLIPEAPAGRAAYFAPIGGFPESTLQDLVAYYQARYALTIGVLPATPLPRELITRGDQAASEDVIELMRATYAEANEPQNVVIGLLPQDIYIRRLDWDWAFGFRQDGHLAVVSTARMETNLGELGDALEASRLRKMILKDLGILYYEFNWCTSHRAVRCAPNGGVGDLDAMLETF